MAGLPSMANLFRKEAGSFSEMALRATTNSFLVGVSMRRIGVVWQSNPVCSERLQYYWGALTMASHVRLFVRLSSVFKMYSSIFSQIRLWFCFYSALNTAKHHQVRTKIFSPDSRCVPTYGSSQAGLCNKVWPKVRSVKYSKLHTKANSEFHLRIKQLEVDVPFFWP